MAKQKKVYGYRALLNEPGYHSTAAVVAELTKDDYGWNVQFGISDCNDKINLAFGNPATSSPDDFYNDMMKIWRLKCALRELEKGMRSVRRREYAE